LDSRRPCDPLRLFGKQVCYPLGFSLLCLVKLSLPGHVLYYALLGEYAFVLAEKLQSPKPIRVADLRIFRSKSDLPKS